MFTRPYATPRPILAREGGALPPAVRVTAAASEQPTVSPPQEVLPAPEAALAPPSTPLTPPVVASAAVGAPHLKPLGEREVSSLIGIDASLKGWRVLSDGQRLTVERPDAMPESASHVAHGVSLQLKGNDGSTLHVLLALATAHDGRSDDASAAKPVIAEDQSNV